MPPATCSLIVYGPSLHANAMVANSFVSGLQWNARIDKVPVEIEALMMTPQGNQHFLWSELEKSVEKDAALAALRRQYGLIAEPMNQEQRSAATAIMDSIGSSVVEQPGGGAAELFIVSAYERLLDERLSPIRIVKAKSMHHAAAIYADTMPNDGMRPVYVEFCSDIYASV